MLSYYIKTFGCRLNIAESESIAYLLSKSGFRPSENKETSDFFIINSCSVTHKADIKLHQFIRSVGQFGKPVFITGCAYYEEDRTNKIFYIPAEKKTLILDRILSYYDKKDILGTESPKSLNTQKPVFFPPSMDQIYHTRAFLKIQDGCDQECTYCKVRLARGKSISLEPGKIIENIGNMEKSGFKEIILTGINLSAYSADRMNFSSLLGTILERFPDLLFQLSSLEINYLDDDFYKLIGRPNLKPYFHLPVQSGSPFILKLMKRNYSLEQYRNTIERIREQNPRAFISTDLIIGYPGETEKDFEQTCRLIEEIKFSSLHIFPFSPREGTAAYLEKEGRIPLNIMKERLDIVKDLKNKQENLYVENMLASEFPGFDVFLVETWEDTEDSRILKGKNIYQIQGIIEDPDFKPVEKGDLVKAKDLSVSKVEQKAVYGFRY